MTTLRMINKFGENGGEWFCEPEDRARLEYVKRELQAAVRMEPESGWRLQTRGMESSWHDVERSPA